MYNYVALYLKKYRSMLLNFLYPFLLIPQHTTPIVPYISHRFFAGELYIEKNLKYERPGINADPAA